MTKKIAVINDLSGFGRCSLTAAISVISAMGIQACPLPTAILTAQTGYPHYYLDDYTDKMDIYRQEWQKMGQHFDGIYTGFVASEAQIDQIFHFIDTFYTSDTFLLVDPVMGDDGIKYDIYKRTGTHRSAFLFFYVVRFAVNISSAGPRQSLPGIRRRCPCDPAGYCR